MDDDAKYFPRESIAWPTLDDVEIDKSKYSQIEPGNSQLFVYDYILEEFMETIRVSSYFKNEAVSKRSYLHQSRKNFNLSKRYKNELGWKHYSMHDFPPHNKT